MSRMLGVVGWDTSMIEMSEMFATHDQRLPALIDRARARLAEARSSAEVLEAKAIAEAALHYAKLTKAANETHADCLRMIVRAEMRMADEIDAGQERGEIRKGAGRPRNSPGSGELATTESLGIPDQRLSEWRETRDAGMPVIESAIENALADGRAPTKADIQRAVAGKPHVTHNSGENEWYTPPAFLEAARAVMGQITMDPASSVIANRLVQAEWFYTAENNGLRQPWRGNVWMNPPYAQPLIGEFIEALVAKYHAKEFTCACVLVNNATDTTWFQSLLSVASALCFVRGRVKFLDPSGEATGAPLQGQVVAYVGLQSHRFARAFAEFGTVLFKDL